MDEDRSENFEAVLENIVPGSDEGSALTISAAEELAQRLQNKTEYEDPLGDL